MIADARQLIARPATAAASLIEASRPRRVRSIREFAESTIVIPDGPYRGEPFRVRRQPIVGVLFDAMSDTQWQRVAVAGPMQSGKTLAGYVVPVMYHLLEQRETVICGIPDLKMANDKWSSDFRPVVEASPELRRYLPERGEGSRGGDVKRAVQFRSPVSAWLRFMGAGGADTQRAGFTSRVLAVTEVDAIDLQRGRGVEADKLSQMIGRTRAFSSASRPPRVYLECIRTVADGRITREIEAGTNSRLLSPCPHCDAWILPGRDDLHGWREATSELQAAESAYFVCPDCGENINDEQRAASVADCRLVHAGQSIDKNGDVVGDAPRTRTLGFSYEGWHNLFQPTAALAADEWNAERERDRDNAERRVCQQVWGIPYKTPDDELSPLEPAQLIQRQADHVATAGIVPPDAVALVAGIDVGKWILHYCVVAFLADGTPHVVEHQTINVPSDDMDVELAILTALRQWRDDVGGVGWLQNGERRQPDAVWIDSGWKPEPVRAFQRESVHATPGRLVYRAALGLGSNRREGRYGHPRAKSKQIRKRGDNYYIEWETQHALTRAKVNSDYWKAYLHERLRTPANTPGALRLYYTPRPQEHYRYVMHLTAEEFTEEWSPKRGGRVYVWTTIRRDNHWLDASYLALAAGHYCGVRLVNVEEPQQPKQQAPATEPAQHAGYIAASDYGDGNRPYLATER
jgi:phage terminase large subunit GpA-like protein